MGLRKRRKLFHTSNFRKYNLLTLIMRLLDRLLVQSGSWAEWLLRTKFISEPTARGRDEGEGVMYHFFNFASYFCRHFTRILQKRNHEVRVGMAQNLLRKFCH